MNTSVTQETETRESQATAEISIEQKETEGLSQGQIVRRRFFRHRGAMIAIVVLALIVILAFTSVGVNLWGLRITDLDVETVVAARRRERQLRLRLGDRRRIDGPA